MDPARTEPSILQALGAGAPETEMPRRNRQASQEILRVLANNLKRLREARGYTQEELANRCRFKKNYISNVEQATVNITLANLEALAKGLGCTEVQLVKRPSNP